MPAADDYFAMRVLAHTLPIACLALLAWAPAAQTAGEGLDVGEPSLLRNLVPAGELEQHAAAQYEQVKRDAARKGALLPTTHPQVQRLRAIARRMIPFAGRFNSRAAAWQWEVNLIGTKDVNAFCMPGGKIALFTGLLEGLALTDDEAAAVIGHEIAHALREHARERAAKAGLTRLGTTVLGELVGGGRYSDAFQLGGGLLSLKFSRDDETEADLIGLELAARAGFDPRAGITLWRKMGATRKSAPPQWLSTHPAGGNRIAEMERRLPQVMPLYRAAEKR